MPEQTETPNSNSPNQETNDNSSMLGRHLTYGLAGAGIGGGLSALLSSRVKIPSEEDNPGERRRRILRDALLGAGIVGGSSAALSYGLTDPSLKETTDPEGRSIASRGLSNILRFSPALGSGFFGLNRVRAGTEASRGVALRELSKGTGNSLNA
ncbi:hypothetical protein V6O07_05955, partial [Arthrospira platensis SPKY2]